MCDHGDSGFNGRHDSARHVFRHQILPTMNNERGDRRQAPTGNQKELSRYNFKLARLTELFKWNIHYFG